MIEVFKPRRGMVTDRAAAYYLAAVERELTVRELRLLPLISYTVLNSGKLKANQVNPEEVQILKALAKAGWIVFQRDSILIGGFTLAVSPSFWQHMNYVLFLTYAVQTITPENTPDGDSN